MKSPIIPNFESYQLSNGLTIRSLCGGNHDVIRISLCIPAGAFYAPHRLLGTFTSDMITKGTRSVSAEEWAKKIEYYGAYINSFCTSYFKVFVVSCLTKHFANVWPIVAEAVVAPAFDESELEMERIKKIQAFKMQLMKTSFIAWRGVCSEQHAKGTKYQKNVELEDYQNVTIDQIKQYYSEAYLPNGSFIMLSGKPDDSVFKIIEETLDEKAWKKGEKTLSLEPVTLNPNPRHRIHIPMENKAQSSLIVSCPTISPFDPDYHAWNLTVHIFGGGFLGSRLMQNIREEKGLTYGIGAYCMDDKFFNTLNIQSDLNSDKVEETITEIYKEAEKLKNDIVPDFEFEQAVAVLKNAALQAMDGTISTAESIMNMYMRNLDVNFLQQSFNYLDVATPEDVLRCAQKYLDLDRCIIVDAG